MLGIRHVQLVHYIRNTHRRLPDRAPAVRRATDHGKRVVQECNRLGILVDLAHSTADAVTQALAISKAPMVWSHSSVTRTRKPQWTMPCRPGPAAEPGGRQGHRGQGRRGGPVGPALRRGPDAWRPTRDRLSEIADWLGEDHAAFGTDMNGLIGPVAHRLRRRAPRGRPLGAAKDEREPHPQARHRELRARARSRRWRHGRCNTPSAGRQRNAALL